MKNKKILSLIVAAGMIIGTTGIAPVIANAQGINNIKLYSNTQSSSQKAVINKHVAILNGSTIIGYANKYDMATVTSNNGSTCNVITEFGLIGTVETSALNMVNSGVNQTLNVLNEDGHVSNVTTVLNVRTDATTNSVVKAQLTNNTNFKIVGQQGDWLKIDVEGISGFVFNEFTSNGSSSIGGQVVTGSNIKTTTTSSTTVTSNGSATGTSNGNVVISHTTATKASINKKDETTSSNNTNKTAPIVNHNDNTPSKTTPVVNHNNNAPSKTTPVVNHNDNAPSKTTPIVNHNDNAPSKTTPVVNHNNNAPSKTTPVVNHNDNTPSKTTPVVNHNDNTPSKTTPIVNHNDTTPNKTTPVQQEYTYMPQLSQAVFSGISELRTDIGVSALSQSSSANTTAMNLALQMAKNGNADHTFNEMGAMCGNGSANYIVDMFKNSPEHYNELTNKLYTEAGVAVYKNNQTGEYFTAVQFIAPSTNGIHWHSML